MRDRGRVRDLVCLAVVLVLGAVGLVQGRSVPLLALVDLGFHELGHLLSYGLPVGDVWKAAAGSVAQVVVPLGLAGYFLLNRRERSSAAICLAWAATSLRSVATYVADAPYERLALIGGEHDWALILGPEGLDALGRAGALAAQLRTGAWVLLAAAVGACAWSLLAPGGARSRSEEPAAVGRLASIGARRTA